MTVPDDLSVGGRHLFQGGQGRLGFGLLDHSHHCVQDDNDHNGNGVDHLPHENGDPRGHDQDDHQKIVELAEQQLEKAGAGLFGEFIRPVLLQPLLHLRLSQALFQVGLKLADHLPDLPGMAFLRLHGSSPDRFVNGFLKGCVDRILMPRRFFSGG